MTHSGSYAGASAPTGVKAAVIMVAGTAVTGNQGARRIEVEERAR